MTRAAAAKARALQLRKAAARKSPKPAARKSPKSAARKSPKSAARKMPKNLHGAEGRWGVSSNGSPVFRFTKGVSAARMAVVRGSARRAPRALSPRAAKAAFTRHYNNLPHSARGRAIARGRDICDGTKETVADTRYSKKGGPRRYNFAGIDDGSQCKGEVKRVARKASPKQAAALAKGRAVRAAKMGFAALPQAGGRGDKRNDNRGNNRNDNRGNNRNDNRRH